MTPASSENLSGADLSGADLTGADLTGADATDADLGGAVLNNVRGLETVKGLSLPQRRYRFVRGQHGFVNALQKPSARRHTRPAICKTCGACARVRDGVIGFPAHGPWQQVEAATAARNIPAGESWAFLQQHRTMAEVIADDTMAA